MRTQYPQRPGVVHYEKNILAKAMKAMWTPPTVALLITVGMFAGGGFTMGLSDAHDLDSKGRRKTLERQIQILDQVSGIDGFLFKPLVAGMKTYRWFTEY